MDTNTRYSTEAIRQATAVELRALRARRDMSQVDLAQAAGIGRSTLRRLEKGERDLDLPQAMAIAEALGVSFVDLFAAIKNVLEREEF